MSFRQSSSGEKRRLFDAEALPHLDAVYTMAVRLTHNADDANDLVQETMLRAYRFFHQFKAGTNCRAWLLTILFNNFRNGYRRSIREQTASSPEDFEHRVEEQSAREDPSASNPEAILANRMLDREVALALKKLPEEFRTAMILVDVQELSYQEASEALEVPIGTVKSRVSRGRTTMRRELKEYGLARRLTVPEQGEK